MNPEVILEARNIVKRYPGGVALDDVTVPFYRNAVNVLIGENGAGKSTLMRILSAVETADEGEIWLEDKRLHMTSPRDARAQGISIVHQELSVLPNLDVSENIFAGRELTRSGFLVDRDREDRQSASVLSRLRKPLDTQIPAFQLSLGCRQIVEIARALAHGSKVLILDEPTSALSTAETGALFGAMAEIRDLGITIIYISHRLHELLHVGEYFTVLRSGRVVGQAQRAEVTRQWIVETMSGRINSDLSAGRPVKTGKDVTLAVNGLCLKGEAGDDSIQAPLQNITFALHAGEILGVYGLLGSGRTELLESLAGARPRVTGRIQLRGRELSIRSVADAVSAGIALVPEDRKRDGLIPELSIRENIALACPKRAWISQRAESLRVREIADRLRIRARDLELPVTALSGGNQQKVILARCLMRSPFVLLLDEPTRGVDATAKLEIYRLLRELAAEGLSILFTSSEIEETETLSDRVIVLCRGAIAAEFTGASIKDAALFSAASPAAGATYIPAEGRAFA